MPIDLRVTSLITLKYAFDNSEGQVRVVLMYSELLTDSISELLFSRRRNLDELFSPEFKETLAILKNRYEAKMASPYIFKYFHGYNVRAAQHFVKANYIHKIYVPKTYKLHTPKRAFNPIPLLKKTDAELIEVDWPVSTAKTEKDELINLFNS